MTVDIQTVTAGILLAENGIFRTREECCCVTVNCCAILENFPSLFVDLTVDGATETFEIIGAPEGGWSAQVEGGAGDISGEYAVEIFFDCVDGAGGESGIYTLRVVLANSAPCLSDVSETQEHSEPCCPLELTFSFSGSDLGTCISSGISAVVRTPGDVPCP